MAAQSREFNFSEIESTRFNNQYNTNNQIIDSLLDKGYSPDGDLSESGLSEEEIYKETPDGDLLEEGTIVFLSPEDKGSTLPFLKIENKTVYGTFNYITNEILDYDTPKVIFLVKAKANDLKSIITKDGWQIIDLKSL